MGVAGSGSARPIVVFAESDRVSGTTCGTDCVQAKSAPARPTHPVNTPVRILFMLARPLSCAPLDHTQFREISLHWQAETLEFPFQVEPLVAVALILWVPARTDRVICPAPVAVPQLGAPLV